MADGNNRFPITWPKWKEKVNNIVGWTADTSIEFDHEYFAGFLKVTVEELLVALTDQAHLFFDLEEQGQLAQNTGDEMSFGAEPFSLYENGFNGKEFVNVIEESRVWERCGSNTSDTQELIGV